MLLFRADEMEAGAGQLEAKLAEVSSALEVGVRTRT